jgi:phosphoenolpyruvate carboxykinase (ATP)
MPIDQTRQMVRAAINGDLEGVETVEDPIFNVRVPVAVPDVPGEVLRPRGTWADPTAYDEMASKLARMFAANFGQFADGVSAAIRDAGPVVDGEAGGLSLAGPGEG